MSKNSKQWLVQAHYDLGTAQYMFKGKRYFYAVFMCHLAVEKAFKGLYQNKFKKFPPKTHSLIFLMSELNLEPSERTIRFLIKIDQASVMTRYPEDLVKLQKIYTAVKTRDFLTKAKETLQWVEKSF